MLGFNHLLEDAGLPLATVKLVRHQDNRSKRDRTPYRLWRTRRDEFELYQRLQSKPRFTGASHLASFAATPTGETLFIGLYDVGEVGVAAPGTIDPVLGIDVGGHQLYELTRNAALDRYEGRVVIDWGLGFRTWVQNAKSNDKAILEIRREVEEERFPGLLAFRRPIDEMDTMPTSWRTVLSEARGVYLLVCRQTGKPYVGAAYGGDGFLGRWEEYAASGHGGNLGMKAHVHKDYAVSILEVASSSATEADICALEAAWKDKLLSMQFGLNQN